MSNRQELEKKLDKVMDLIRECFDLVEKVEIDAREEEAERWENLDE